MVFILILQRLPESQFTGTLIPHISVKKQKKKQKKSSQNTESI